MKPEEINNAIDELVDPSNRLLNYHGSLDACAEFEKTLTVFGYTSYVRCLNLDVIGVERPHCATPPQRCEAFLRVKGIWK